MYVLHVSLIYLNRLLCTNLFLNSDYLVSDCFLRVSSWSPHKSTHKLQECSSEWFFAYLQVFAFTMPKTVYKTNYFSEKSSLFMYIDPPHFYLVLFEDCH